MQGGAGSMQGGAGANTPRFASPVDGTNSVDIQTSDVRPDRGQTSVPGQK